MRRRGVPIAVAIALAAAVAAGGRPGRAESPEDAAKASAEAWLALVDQGKYAESHGAAAKLLKKALTSEKWTQAIEAARGPLGKVVARTPKSRQYLESLPGAPDGRYVVIQYETSFERKKAAVETITPMVDPDGAWRVSGYYIR